MARGQGCRLGRARHLGGLEPVGVHEVAAGPEDHPPSPERAYVLTQEALVRDILHLPGAAEVGQEALDVARQVDDPRVEATALVIAAVAPVESGILAVDDADVIGTDADGWVMPAEYEGTVA